MPLRSSLLAVLPAEAWGYGRVTVTSDAEGTQGKTVTEFSNDPDLGATEAQTYPFPPPTPWIIVVV